MDAGQYLFASADMEPSSAIRLLAIVMAFRCLVTNHAEGATPAPMHTRVLLGTRETLKAVHVENRRLLPPLQLRKVSG